MFYENLGLKGSESIRDLLTRGKAYINYEDKLLEEDVKINKVLGNPTNGLFEDRGTH